METETALDVLSRAASLLDQGTHRDGGAGIVRQENGSPTDLPQRGIKVRRKERRGQDYMNSKMRIKSRTAGTQTSVSLMQVSVDDDTEDEWLGSEGRDSRQESDTDSEDGCDSPLDMTTTNRKSVDAVVEEPQIRSSVVQQRPSVITCAPTLYEHKRRDVRLSSTSGPRRDRKGEEVRHGHRREILSGMCDPVIDEHFRRSLGKDYPEVFSGTPVTNNTVTVSGLSVDDHFAKALGETWLRLQGKLDTPESKSTSNSNSTQGSVNQQRNVLNTQKSIA